MSELRYRVIEKSTQQEPVHDYVVTKDGDVAFWSESEGWDVDHNQDQYDVIIGEEVFSVWLRNLKLKIGEITDGEEKLARELFEDGWSSEKVFLRLLEPGENKP